MSSTDDLDFDGLHGVIMDGIVALKGAVKDGRDEVEKLKVELDKLKAELEVARKFPKCCFCGLPFTDGRFGSFHVRAERWMCQSCHLAVTER